MTDMTVRELMNTEVLTISEGSSLTHLAEFLLDHEISGAPVTDETGELVGVVSLTDLATASSEGEGDEVDDFGGTYFDRAWSENLGEDLVGLRISTDDRTVGDVMNRTLYTVDADAAVGEAARIMLESHVHRLVVTESSAVVGIITTSDLLTLLVDSGS